MAKLVAFYSRAGENHYSGVSKIVEVGNTEKVARKIAAQTGAALFRIEQQTPYPEGYHACATEARRDKQENARPVLAALPEDFGTYDEVYLGYPNYFGTMPMAVYTFLESLDFSGKTVHPFCTHEGGGLSDTVNDIKKTVPAAVVTAGFAVRGGETDDCDEALAAWLKDAAK